MPHPHRLLAATAAAALALSTLAFTEADEDPVGRDWQERVVGCAGDHSSEDHVVTSRAQDGVGIAITVHQPRCTSPDAKVPVILHSHGWSGSRASDAAAFARELDAGFGVVSIDQRGHGDSGGEANVQDPELEAQDILAVIDHVAALDWVRLDTDEAGDPVAGDPMLFGMGYSYGGAFQTVTALTEIAETGETRFDALAPEITWFDLPQSLAPHDVARTEWNTALYGGGMAQARPAPFLTEGFAYAATTGEWPDGTVLDQPDPTGLTPDLDTILHGHGPVAFVEQGVHLDLPVIWRQGATDTLFNLNQGLHNFERTLTDAAREDSIFVGYNGGHVLPTAYPTVTDGSGGDPCSDGLAEGGWSELRIAFFAAVAAGVDPDDALRASYPELQRYNLSTDRGGCIRTGSLPQATAPTAAGVGAVAVDDAWLTATGAGAAVHLELHPVLGEGDAVTAVSRIAGLPRLSGTVTSVGVDQRILFGLSRGTSPADATLIQSNLLPLRVALPDDVGRPFEMELPGIAAELEPGERLFLTLTPISEQFVGHGSTRTPGSMGFTDLRVDLPLVRPEPADAFDGIGE